MSLTERECEGSLEGVLSEENGVRGLGGDVEVYVFGGRDGDIRAFAEGWDWDGTLPKGASPKLLLIPSYTAKYIAQVGRYPRIVGPKPL